MLKAKKPNQVAPKPVKSGEAAKSVREKNASKKVPKKAPKVKKTKKRKSKISFWVKDIILAVVNIGFIVALVIIVGRLPARASRLKFLKNEDLKVTVKGSLDITEVEIESSRKKADKLLILFPDESGLIGFVKEIDDLKEEGIVTRFAFASENAVRDKTGYYGIPLVIEFAGTWGQIGQALQKIDDLTYLLRAVNIEVIPQPEGDLVQFRYGGFLYVSKDLAKD